MDLISPAQRMNLITDVFQMAGTAPLSNMNHYHINGLHLFWDTLFLYLSLYIYIVKSNHESKPALLRLKFDLVSYPTQGEMLG